MKMHGHQIQSKRGVKYALNISMWSTFRNLDHVYSRIYSDIEDAGLTTRRPEEPVWMDQSGNIIDEHGAIGCKVTHNITRPDMCVVGD